MWITKQAVQLENACFAPLERFFNPVVTNNSGNAHYTKNEEVVNIAQFGDSQTEPGFRC